MVPQGLLDALHPQCFSAVLYIYLATITNAITFGVCWGEATDVRRWVGWEAGLSLCSQQPCPMPSSSVCGWG